jgi:hypothetical protein
MSDTKKRSQLQENLLSLYLRLNGYFVTGFIAHSPEWGRNRTEIDALAVRHPYNSEPERITQPSPHLQISTEYIDLLICEVKSKGQPLQFNSPLRESPLALESVLRWTGLFHEGEVSHLASQIQSLIIPSNMPKQDISFVIAPRDIRIRPILCSPERWEKHDNQPYFISGSEIFKYLSACLSPATRRQSCSTRYDFKAWGEVYEPIVKYFKDKKEKGTMQELYQHLGI